MDIISAYREAGTYRGAAAISGTTPKTVRRVIARHEAGGGTPARSPRGHNYDAVAVLVAERMDKTSARISAKRLLPAARAAGYAGSPRNFRRLVAAQKHLWRRDHHRGRRPAVWSPGEHLVIDWGAGKGFTPTVEGTPQGGVISPCLMNVALHGLEEAAGVRYVTSGAHAGEARPGFPVAVRYADDMVVLCHTQEQAEHVKARLAEWLAPRGLAFNEDKTRIVRLSEGFDFLGFNIRRYPNRKLLIKPSEAAIRRLRERLASETRTLRGGNAMAVIAALNPIIRGSPGDASLLRDVA